ncbi:MAG: hypothetical protein K2H32_03270 [Muribaculaceae bacterium]|nr:hypothetical protein [Muribaculaceae bacterium]MDE5857362.1 hypothetical protein [Muribaculaceae bacterium]MDE7155839.1 hypothetical protein [Muribaculaceae bacterium]MDE7368297.1 hypothetical protein [Muribaculaceae bacterium]
MSFEIIITPDFEKAFKALAKRHRSLKQDILDFTKSLQENPFQGDELTPGIRKIRMAIKSKGRGKSGGARVITYTVFATEIEGIIYLIDIYDKADYSTVDVAVIQQMIKNMSNQE